MQFSMGTPEWHEKTDPGGLNNRVQAVMTKHTPESSQFLPMNAKSISAVQT